MWPLRTTRLISVLVVLLATLIAIGFGQAKVRIDFDTLRAEVRDRFDEDRASVVDDLEQLLDDVRARGPEEWTERINAFFNRHMRYVEDHELYGQSDYWASPVEAIGHGAGDCEDFAIAKYLSLRKLGIENSKLRLIYVRARIAGATRAHMVLGYYPEPEAEPLILGSLVDLIVPARNRTDLTPVFSFNSEGIWVGGQQRNGDQATDRLSRWRDVLQRARAEGITLNEQSE
ncbi:transglutaminase [Spiribacter vilamensis]|nr:transglutaminase [Spiribacter vilamensis]